MHFPILLPAILFAQTSFAYHCCYAMTPPNNNNVVAKIFSSGGKENWSPEAYCVVEIDKTGRSCGDWSSRIINNSCISLKAFTVFGPAAASVCGY
ncbi:hypothetical protein Vi05172_g5755 [Venturia inaequalis]|nr:hypothetical protein Vi05172_g5755 [Venturia inaequalis]